jgi:hypothetical protein
MYGESSGQLRGALGKLLQEHRIQQRLGGRGSHTIPETTTGEERDELGEQIRRYRQCVLTWSMQAIWASAPYLTRTETPGSSRGPTEDLYRRLVEATSASTSGFAYGEELVTAQGFATVESWRHAARAAVLGEQDFAAGLGRAPLTEQQRKTVLKDAADIIQGLVALDRRYANVPGWEKLHNQGRLGHAAELCAAHAAQDEPDYSVDRLGWRPTPRTMDGPATPGLDGVIRAEHNLLIQLTAFPNAHTLRLVMDSQRVIAHETSLRATDIDTGPASKWTTRKKTYNRLIRETRDLGGLLGKADAAGPASIAASRAQKLAPEPFTDTTQLRQLDKLFDRIDERVSAAIEHATRERLYFQRVLVPGMDNYNGELIHVMRPKYLPITSQVQTELLTLVRNELRPPPSQRKPPPSSAQSRADFEASLNHRPGQTKGIGI